jgi:hypothetical protein
VAKPEKRRDVYVSPLVGYLQAVGAGPEIRAVFPDEYPVKITLFSQ